MNDEKICVCGLGKLGLPLAATLAASEISVMGFDVDQTKVKLVNGGRTPVVEPYLADYLEMPTVKTYLKATEDVGAAVDASTACLFVTPTPSATDGSFDHHYLLSAVATVAQEVRRQGKRNYLFVISSTVMPGASQWEVMPILSRFVGKDLGFQMAYKPEFIALGSVIQDLHYPNMLLIGAEDEKTHRRVEEIYARMVMASHALNVQAMSLVEAELAKISLNCAITMKISFANQVGMIAARLGADATKVLAAVGKDSRIGPAALRPGLPFGGPCFPRDNRMFQKVAQLVGEQAPLAVSTDVVNRRVRQQILQQVPSEGLVGILGLAYKPGTPVMDESLGLWLRRMLVQQGRKVLAHDVMAPHSHTIDQVLSCPIVVVACAWPEYQELAVNSKCKLIDPMRAINVSAVERVEVAS